VLDPKYHDAGIKNMPYCFMNYRPAREGHGLEPECPDGVDYLLLADLPGLGWGLFEIDLDDARFPAEGVSQELSALIESAKRYPPALALAREEMGQVFGDHLPAREEFAKAYGTALRVHLSRQHEAPYLLVEALKDEAGDLSRGEWYWVLGISGSPALASWVSDDYHVHKNGVNDFDFTGQQMKALGYFGY
jgi:hypothetical protein